MGGARRSCRGWKGDPVMAFDWRSVAEPVDSVSPTPAAVTSAAPPSRNWRDFAEPVDTAPQQKAYNWRDFADEEPSAGYGEILTKNIENLGDSFALTGGQIL